MERGVRPPPPTVPQAFVLILVTLLLSFTGDWLLHDLLGRASLFVLELLFLVPVIAYVFIQKQDFPETFRLRPVNYRVLILSLVIGLGLSVVIDEVDRLIQMVFPMPAEIIEAIEGVLSFQTPGDFVLVIAGGVIAAGFAEEMLFRGFFQGVMERRMDVTKAVNLTALVFALIHFNPWWLVQILLMGVVLGVLAWRTGSIFPAVIVHMVNNAVSVVLISMEESHLEWYFFKGHVSPLFVILGMGGIIYGFLAVYRVTASSDDHHENS